MPIKQRVLRKANDDVCYVCRADRGLARFEFAVSNALLHEASQEFLATAQAFLDRSPPKLKVCLKELMAACRPVDDVRSRAVLRHDSYCATTVARIRSLAAPFFAAAVSARIQDCELNRSSPATKRSCFLFQ